MDKSYWDSFYKNIHIDEKLVTEVDGRVLDAPEKESPFARFCLESINDEIGTIIDVGCGNGRDSFFFKKSGVDCIGIDQSMEVTIDNNNKCSDKEYLPFFQAGDFSSFNFDSAQTEFVSVYSRFTLHAINLDEENKFFENIDSSKKLKYLFIEVRSIKDVLCGQGTKLGKNEYMTSHYRRFIDFSEILARVSINFEILHAEENIGLSKTEVDDPCLIRIIAKRIF